MRQLLCIAACLLVLLCNTVQAADEKPSLEALRAQVEATEHAFAKTMADRDHAAFAGFLAEETVFWSPGVTRGKAAVAKAWERFYSKKEAPFSWAPSEVQVLDSGTLALSTGPVYDPSGKLVSHYLSIWRLEAPGTWRIIFDKGCNDVCEDCASKSNAGKKS